jgi:hypothetical protein
MSDDELKKLDLPIMRRFIPTLTNKEDLPIQDIPPLKKETFSFGLKCMGYTDEEIAAMTVEEAFAAYQTNMTAMYGTPVKGSRPGTI